MEEQNLNGINRVRLIRDQLLAKREGVQKSNKNPLNKWKKKCNFDKDLLEELYYPFHRDLRDQIYKIMSSNPEFRHFYQSDMTIDQIRELTFKQMKVLIRELDKIISFKELRSDVKKFYTFLECVTSYDLGMSVKFGVHCVLYYNCLKNLATEKHMAYLDRAFTFEDIGCFGLTEFGHGSNVRDLKTTATYDEDHQEFILNSPSYEAYKWWIGGAGKTANMAAIFAQMYIKGVSQGVHCFLVPIRNKIDNMPYPGVICGDCGPKVGNENIDNGFIAFTNYRIPREALLDRYSQVSEDGVFSSPITNPDVRFATVLGALEEGRITISAGTQVLLRNSLVVAGRYSALRKQFGREEGEEVAILNYPTTQIRIIPALAEHFAFRFASQDLSQRWVDAVPFLKNPKNESVVEMHAILSVLKPLSTHHVQQKLQHLREVLGGHGYSRFAMIGLWRNNNDINVTWEGDNTILIQQAAKFVANNLNKKMKGKEIKYKTLSFMSKFDEISGMKMKIESGKDLKNIDNLVSILEYKVSYLLQKSAGRLAENMGNKSDLFEAWNNTQVFFLQNMVKAYGELYIFNCFKDKIDNLRECSTKALLNQMLVLVGLTWLEKDLAILRENDYLPSEAGDIIKLETLELCSVLKDQLIPILDVISPPDDVVGSSLGHSDGFIFERYINSVFTAKGTFERPDWWEYIHHKKY